MLSRSAQNWRPPARYLILLPDDFFQCVRVCVRKNNRIPTSWAATEISTWKNGHNVLKNPLFLNKMAGPMLQTEQCTQCLPHIVGNFPSKIHHQKVEGQETFNVKSACTHAIFKHALKFSLYQRSSNQVIITFLIYSLTSHKMLQCRLAWIKSGLKYGAKEAHERPPH